MKRVVEEGILLFLREETLFLLPIPQSIGAIIVMATQAILMKTTMIKKKAIALATTIRLIGMKVAKANKPSL